MSDGVAAHLRRHPLVAILRGVPSSHVAELGLALVAGGVRSLEVTFTDEDAEDKIHVLGDALAGRAQVGAGTVTTRTRAEHASAAGATFLVTPHVASDVNAFARDHGLVVVGGATTPTEIARSLDEGCAFVKLFPAGALGPAYLKALTGPYPNVEIFAVGGVGLDNARAFLDAGAIGLGVGGALTGLDWRRPDYASVTRLAASLVDAIDASRAADAGV